MWQLANPVALAKHVRLMLRGRKPGRPGKNVWQLGGDVLIDPDRIVRMHVRSAEPHDRPTVESILSVVRESSTDS